MSDLSKASNIVQKKERPIVELLNENISLNRKNCFLWVGLVGLSALSALSIYSCHKIAKELDRLRLENTALKEKLVSFQTDDAHITSKSQKIKPHTEFSYANTADGKTKEIQDMQKHSERKPVSKKLGFQPTYIPHLREI